MELINEWVSINLGRSAILKARIGWQGLTTAEYMSSGDYYLVTGTDFLNGFIDWNNCVYVEKERYDQDKYIQLQVNDILVTKDGTIGKVAIIDKIIKPTTLNSGVFVIRPVKKSFYPKYLYYILRSVHFSDFLTKLTAGSTINHLYQKDFVYYTFPAPPIIEEQKKIANVLGDTDQLIQDLKKLISKKKAIKQGAMQELLTGKKRLQGFTEEWETRKFGEIAFIQRGASPRPINNPIWFDEKSTVGWVRISDVTKSTKFLSKTVQKFSEQGINNSRFVSSDSLIMSICATIGRPIITEINVCIHDGFVVFRDLKLEKEFLYYYLTFIEDDWSKNGQTGSQMNLNTGIINQTEIKYPLNDAEQQAIAQILSDLDAEIDALEHQLLKTQSIKQGMMQELLTGKTRLVIKKESRSEKRNEHFTDAVLIGTMAEAFGSKQFPLTRFMYTKVSYLLKRYKEEQDTGYLKKAAGPYKPNTRYGGAEKIAIQNDYVKKHISIYKGKKYENFLSGDKVKEAIDYFKKWYGESTLQWIKQFKYTKREQLELLATVDMAVQDLKNDNCSVNVITVKELINNNKEWRPKLKRPIFSDENIETTISKLKTLFA